VGDAFERAAGAGDRIPGRAVGGGRRRIDPARVSPPVRLRDENMILLHPCVSDDYDDDGLIRYHTEWMPALIEEVKP